MKYLLNILILLSLSSSLAAQEETRVIDSLESLMAKQEGREKVGTMMELSKAFFDFSFDDCIDWGEKAVLLSHEIGDAELEADANYALGLHYGYHSDLDLSQSYLKQSLTAYRQLNNDKKAFEALWNLAYFELVLGNLDTAKVAFQEVLSVANQRHDTLACAQSLANLAVIQFQLNDYNGSIESLRSSRAYYVILNDSANLAQTDFNLATLYGEYGRTNEARKLYLSVIPRLMAFNNYDFLLLAYKNYGILFERDMINYDSASYYFEKAIALTNMEGLSRQDRQTVSNTKSDVLVELGNVAMLRKEFQQAVGYYEEALGLAESNHYHFGQMQALVGLGQLYAQTGRASQSMQCFDRYAQLASSSGITMMEPVVRKSLILNFARLGRYDELQKEIEDLDEQRAALASENFDLAERNEELQSEVTDLLHKYEFRNRQLVMAQSQRNHYRLAFFGLLAIVISVVVCLVAYKIVRKKRPK